ncbi:MAG: 16S rRNA (cytosine(1402)-N(4))-methyltransferase RsmH [Selenomonadaceae bacterium]|nr:16S rRNA (cytosine(1402)-N(4))-methyltransferase RsmH [Selenomonadaceae bacterium]
MDFRHISVLAEEAVAGLNVRPDGIYVDCTLGGAGHAKKIAEGLSESGRLIGIDQDPAAIAAGGERLRGCRARVDLARSNFCRLADILTELQVEKVDGVLFDLGVSSYQLDTAGRGFSYMQDAPLDMRMDPDNRLSAYEVVNEYSPEELARIFREYGEERWGKRVALFIDEARKKQPIVTTGELNAIIAKAIPRAVRREKSGHPSKRIFQAIRIEVNQELTILASTFREAVSRLNPGGRIAIITFHSLEDRLAKETLKDLARGCICSPHLPVCVCHHRPEVKLLGKPILPTVEELERNPRAKSAKLRLAEKIV